IDTPDPISAQTPGGGGIRPVMGKGLLSRVEAVKPSQGRADPQDASVIYVNRVDPVIAQAIGIVRIASVGLQTISIVPVQSNIGAKPQEPVFVLRDPACYSTLKRFLGEVGEADVLLINDR